MSHRVSCTKSHTWGPSTPFHWETWFSVVSLFELSFLPLSPHGISDLFCSTCCTCLLVSLTMYVQVLPMCTTPWLLWLTCLWSELVPGVLSTVLTLGTGPTPRVILSSKDTPAPHHNGGVHSSQVVSTRDQYRICIDGGEHFFLEPLLKRRLITFTSQTLAW